MTGERRSPWCREERSFVELRSNYLEQTMDPEAARCWFDERLRDAGLDTLRVIDVDDGEKESYDHTQRELDGERLSGN